MLEDVLWYPSKILALLSIAHLLSAELTYSLMLYNKNYRFILIIITGYMGFWGFGVLGFRV